MFVHVFERGRKKDGREEGEGGSRKRMERGEVKERGEERGQRENKSKRE